MAAVAVKYPAFRELGAEILAISVDTVATHKDWQERELSRMVEGGARFPMLADTDGRIGSLYDVYDKTRGVNVRAHFLIDPEGVIQAVEAVAAPIGRNVGEILRQLRALEHHRSTGRYMPCGWEPGKPALSAEGGGSASSGRVWEVWKPSNAF
jgi:peroxiredoxin (alkyl hydroperoxide reductase subunit C)